MTTTFDVFAWIIGIFLGLSVVASVAEYTIVRTLRSIRAIRDAIKEQEKLDNVE
jgi:hypothetical protein